MPIETLTRGADLTNFGLHLLAHKFRLALNGAALLKGDLQVNQEVHFTILQFSGTFLKEASTAYQLHKTL